MEAAHAGKLMADKHVSTPRNKIKTGGTPQENTADQRKTNKHIKQSHSCCCMQTSDVMHLY